MTKKELAEFYKGRSAQHLSSLASTNKKIGSISNIRLAIAIIFFLLLYLGFRNHDIFYTLPVPLIAFVALVRAHSRLFDTKVHLENLISVQKEELSALRGDISHNSSGSEFIDTRHPYSHDLDIFGEGSLFQYLNRANTAEGKKLLAQRLSARSESVEEVLRWQEAIAELAPKVDFRQEVQALGMQISEQSNDRRELQQWLAEPAFIYGKSFYKPVLKIFPAITVTLVALAFFIEGISGFAVFAAGMQWVFLGFHLKRVNHFHQYISNKKNTLKKYAGILSVIKRETYRSSLMQAIGERAGEADVKVNRLASLVRTFDARLNSMTSLFVNSLLLYDLQCVYRLEKWKSENAPELMRWLDTIKETEALISLATFSFNHPQFNFPSVNDEQKLAAKGLGHPLLGDDERVVNDVHLDEEASIIIITGANMAGKSTFLRTLGVNVVLALAGAPACAEAFECPLVNLRTGMRTADSLKENQSYFYAELDRLKSIMDELRSGKRLMILLDEILKGTNSTDKQAGSIALVKQLADYPCLVVIATHDLALGDLESLYPQKVSNCSFEANIEDDHLSFDYKLKKGIARKMNATFLMKKMGIVGAN